MALQSWTSSALHPILSAQGIEETECFLVTDYGSDFDMKQAKQQK